MCMHLTKRPLQGWCGGHVGCLHMVCGQVSQPMLTFNDATAGARKQRNACRPTGIEMVEKPHEISRQMLLSTHMRALGKGVKCIWIANLA